MSPEITLSDEARSLSMVTLFRQLDPDELEKLAVEVDQVHVKVGETIFHEQDQGDALYVIDEGAVRIWVRDEDVQEVTISELKAGDFFGELSVLDNGKRSANATAMADSTLHRLSSADLQEFLLRNPAAAVDLIREIGARMRQTNALISKRVARNINREMEKKLTLGQRVADQVAAFGGSWTFIFLYMGFMIIWVALNTFVLARYGKGDNGAQFDPYPYILLNLMLSMTAALQAPVIMMSQNRASEKDRLAAEQDFKVNLKSELMLEELLRRDRVHAERIDQLTLLTKSLHGNAKVNGGDHPTA